MAAVVVGCARPEAEAGGECPFGEAAEFPEGDHADLLLDALFLGEGDGLAGTVCEHESTVFDLHVEVESAMHGHCLPRGRVGVPERGRYVHVIYALSQKPSTVEQGQIGSGGFMSINVDMVEGAGRWKGTGQLVQECNVPLYNAHPLGPRRHVAKGCHGDHQGRG